MGNEILTQTQKGLVHGLSTKCGKFHKLVLGTIEGLHLLHSSKKEEKGCFLFFLDLKDEVGLEFVFMNRFVSF